VPPIILSRLDRVRRPVSHPWFWDPYRSVYSKKKHDDIADRAFLKAIGGKNGVDRWQPMC